MAKYKHFVTRQFLGERQSDHLIKDLEVRKDLITAERVGQVYWDIPYTDPDYTWLYEKCMGLADMVNFAHWNFDITGWQQPLRISKYYEGKSMDWHLDHIDTDESKLAFSVALNTDYEGGEFELIDTDMPTLKVGQGIVFPAYHAHRVKPVTSGTRYVLLGWLTGPRFI